MGVILPEHILNKLSPQDREEISRMAGNPNAGRTAQECQKIAQDRAEKDAQKEISQFLRISGIEFVNPPMNRKSAMPEGWPDFTFARKGLPFGLEVKVRDRKPRSEQSARHEAMKRNGWLVYVVSGAAEVKDIFRAMDAQNTINPLDGMPDPSADRRGRS